MEFISSVGGRTKGRNKETTKRTLKQEKCCARKRDESYKAYTEYGLIVEFWKEKERNIRGETADGNWRNGDHTALEK